MYTQSRKLILASGIALTMAVNSGTVFASTVSQDVIEARQETQIWTTYALNPNLRANDLQVSVHNGKATLTGAVEEDVSRDLAGQIALNVNGVTEVDNQIVVQADYIPPVRSSGRSYGEVVDDATITSTVKSKLLWSKHTDGLTTDVDTKSGKVRLTGSADSAAEKDLATRLALNTRGVVSVDNQQVVKTAKPTVVDNTRSAAHEAKRVISDSWITSKVISTFMYSTNVNGSDITVSTKHGIVTLSGKVDSGAERAMAIELAGNVRGVKNVQSKGLTL